MKENIGKASERGGKLDHLERQTGELEESAQGFRKGANRVRKTMWWKDTKMKMCLIVGIIILIVIIVVPSGTSIVALDGSTLPKLLSCSVSWCIVPAMRLVGLRTIWLTLSLNIVVLSKKN